MTNLKYNDFKNHIKERDLTIRQLNQKNELLLKEIEIIKKESIIYYESCKKMTKLFFFSFIVSISVMIIFFIVNI